jgi:intraflagellar transport protein 88
MSRGDSASASFGGPRTGKLMTGSQGDGRPMTSVRAAGYSSRGRTAVPSTGFDPFNQASRSQEKVVISPEDQIKDLEKRVHALIHESCVASKQGNYKVNLDCFIFKSWRWKKQKMPVKKRDRLQDKKKMLAREVTK